MSDKTYSILRWDAVLFGNSEYPTPIIYVEPEPSLLEFAKENNDALLVSIKSTNSIYDGKQIAGVFASSGEIPNCREIYFNKTKLYVIVLQAEWHGYPDSLGECDIYGLKGGVPAKEINNVQLYQQVPTIENYTDTPKDGNECGLQNIPLIGVSVGIFIILIAVLFLLKK